MDLDDEKLATARGFGATHTVNSRQQDPVAAIRELTGGFGADLVIDAVGIADGLQAHGDRPAKFLAGRTMS